ncbi:MAG: redoxin domain-containing protein [Bacteroidales bacterium]|nr:redoxin domain-containing protein [Bacteroidales bacterium]
MNSSSPQHNRRPAGFREKHNLPFTLLSDTTRELHEAFGAIGEKKMYGKTVIGTLRRTFIFDEDGILERIIKWTPRRLPNRSWRASTIPRPQYGRLWRR